MISSTSWTASKDSLDEEEEYLGVNRTELLQIAADIGLRVHPALPKERVVELIRQVRQPVPGELNPVDTIRNGIIQLLQDYWTVIEPQLACPAKFLGPRTNNDPDPSDPAAPRACYQCEDAKVISCLLSQAGDQQDQVQIRRKYSERKPTMSAINNPTPTRIEDVPRTPEALASIPRFGRAKIAAMLQVYDPTDTKGKVAFLDASNEVQIKAILEALAKQGIPVEAAGAAPAAPVAPAVTPPTATATVTPRPAPVEEPVRTPDYSKLNGGAPPVKEAATVGHEVLQALQELMQTNREAVAAILEMRVLAKEVAELKEAVVQGNKVTAAALLALKNISSLSFGASMVLAENMAGMPPKDLIELANDQVNRFLAEPEGKEG